MNKLKYDSCSYHDSIWRSKAPFDYHTDIDKYQNPAICLAPYGLLGGSTVTKSLASNYVDIESMLMNRTRHATKCPVEPLDIVPPPSDIPICKPMFERPYMPSNTAVTYNRNTNIPTIVQSLP